jgi:hypothetical protein
MILHHTAMKTLAMCGMHAPILNNIPISMKYHPLSNQSHVVRQAQKTIIAQLLVSIEISRQQCSKSYAQSAQIHLNVTKLMTQYYLPWGFVPCRVGIFPLFLHSESS